VLSSVLVDGSHMYSGGSVVGKASTICIEILPTPPLIFTGLKKCEIWRRFQHHSTLNRPHLKSSKISKLWNRSAMLRWSPYALAKFREVGSAQPWENCVSCSPSIIARRTRAKSSITQPLIMRFRSNFVQTVQTLNAW